MANKTVDISEDDMMGEAPLIDNPSRETLEAQLTEVEEKSLKERLLLEEKLKQTEEKLLHAMADLENLRKQSEKRILDAHKYSVSKLLEDLVPVLDSIEQGLAVGSQSATMDTMHEGMVLTSQVLIKVLEKFGVKIINPEINQTAFDPGLHEVMLAQETADVSPNIVIAVMQKGYVLHDRLLRPARVIVSKAPVEKN